MDKSKDNIIAKTITVNGIVQGVGFRPFIFQLADRLGLNGEVANTAAGVTIHIEGKSEQVDIFCREIADSHPSLACIIDLKVYDEEIKGVSTFIITSSRPGSQRSTLVSPDMSICDDCLYELFDRKNRRFGYPFINCTNCGPRYTIIEDIPYDRSKTTMKQFTMCDQCRAEYEDPQNRRFHAQPNACALCGPYLELYDQRRHKIAPPDPVNKAAEMLLAGCIVAIKGLGGFHLAVDATNDAAVSVLRHRKRREAKPMAVMALNTERISQFAHMTPEAEILLTSRQRPIVLLKKKKENNLCKSVAPLNGYFGVMLPYTPLHYLLLDQVDNPLVMTSGNISEDPIVIDNQEAFDHLSDIADYFLIHNRNIYLQTDDSIVQAIAGKPRFIRRSRGYVPAPIFLRKPFPSVLACGAGLKNTVCLTKKEKAFVSQHIGSLDNLSTYEFFQMTIDHLKRILDIKPEVIACDMHPDYLSTRYAHEQKDLPLIQVQHHHAHIVSCLAENKEKGPVIGLAFDGTGYGTDGTIWGGEVLMCREDRFHRIGHLMPVPMPGGTVAIREPWRMGISYLYHTYGDKLKDLELPFLKKIDQRNMDVMVEMIQKNVNSPSTSSIGRLFDGVAAILGIRNTAFFEGQAPMELEMRAQWPVSACYDYGWTLRDNYRILIAPIIEAIVKDIRKGICTAEISGKFHLTMIRLFTRFCQVIRRECQLDTVALSGGSFQNSIFLSGLIKELNQCQLNVLTHHQVPCNDGGISLGQALVAASLKEVNSEQWTVNSGQ